MKPSTLIAALVLTIFSSELAWAQLSGQNMRGDTAIGAGSLPESGWSVNAFYSIYDVSDVRDDNGDRILRGTEVENETAALTLQWVSTDTIFGARYSVLVSPGWATSRLESPVLTENDTNWGLADLYIQPIALGWSFERADYTAGIGVYVPTGRYDIDAADNTGLGAWAIELFAGGTWYLDAAQTWSFAAVGFWETFGDIEDSDQRIGEILTLEGGLGKTVGDWTCGLAYFGQWKISGDDLDLDDPAPIPIGNHEVYGIGPELNYSLQRSGAEAAAFNLRYMRDFGARSMTEGDTLTLSVTFPF